MKAIDGLYSVTALIEANSGTGSSRGTGFFFSIPLDQTTNCLLLITNRHVVEGATSLRIRVSISKSDDLDNQIGTATWEMAGGLENAILKHPHLDLAAISIANLFEELHARGYGGHGSFFGEHDIVLDEELNLASIAAEVLMIGYPIGLSDELHNLPLVRQGTLASDPTVPFNGEDCFVIDCACYPGSSGSPVLLKVDPERRLPESRLTRKAGRALAGILYAGPTLTAEGKFVPKPIPTSSNESVRTQIMINLGYVIPAQRILDFKEMIPDSVTNNPLMYQLRIHPNPKL